MRPLPPRETPPPFALIEVVLTDDHDPAPWFEVLATDQIVIRFSAGVSPELAAAVVEAVCAC